MTDLPSPGAQTSLLQQTSQLKKTTFQYFESPWDMDFNNESSTQGEVKWKLKSNLVKQNRTTIFEKH